MSIFQVGNIVAHRADENLEFRVACREALMKSFEILDKQGITL